MPRRKNGALTLKERIFVENYVKNPALRGNGTKSTAIAYPNSRRPYILAGQVLARPEVKNEIEKLLRELGLTDQKIFEKVSEGLDANIIVISRGKAIKTNVPDYNVRHKFLRETLKIGGYYAPTRKINKNLNIDLQIEEMPKEEMKALLSGLMKNLNARKGNRQNRSLRNDHLQPDTENN